MCIHMSATRKKEKQIWTPDQVKYEMIQVAAETIEYNDEALEAVPKKTATLTFSRQLF